KGHRIDAGRSHHVVHPSRSSRTVTTAYTVSAPAGRTRPFRRVASGTFVRSGHFERRARQMRAGGLTRAPGPRSNDANMHADPPDAAAELLRLQECAKEPIRTPGRIQSDGVLLGIDPRTTAVVIASENASE